MIEIARFSRWPYLALVSTHILILPMSMRAGAISAAAAPFKLRKGTRSLARFVFIHPLIQILRARPGLPYSLPSAPAIPAAGAALAPAWERGLYMRCLLPGNG